MMCPDDDARPAEESGDDGSQLLLIGLLGKGPSSPAMLKSKMDGSIVFAFLSAFESGIVRSGCIRCGSIEFLAWAKPP